MQELIEVESLLTMRRIRISLVKVRSTGGFKKWQRLT